MAVKQRGSPKRSTTRAQDQTELDPSCIQRARHVGLVGESAAHRRLLWELSRVAQVNAEILLFGETGVGKGLYAHYIHECSARSGREFTTINCGAIPEVLFENEMFGHSAGAYTDARKRSQGLVAAAEGGTLFLDEVEALPTSAQVKLLRLLQEKEYRRLGETRLRKADIRVISATNADPEVCVEKGQLREDFFYRLTVVQKRIPPLRERPSDIATLLEEFNRRYSEEYCRSSPIEFSGDSRRVLLSYHWPGNVRQLENLVRSLTCQHPDRMAEAEELQLGSLDQADKPVTTNEEDDLMDLGFCDGKRLVVDRFERRYLRKKLRQTKGNIGQAAQLARKNRRAFWELMRKHKIDKEDFR